MRQVCVYVYAVIYCVYTGIITTSSRKATKKISHILINKDMLL
jgi:hypothetical protein